MKEPNKTPNAELANIWEIGTNIAQGAFADAFKKIKAGNGAISSSALVNQLISVLQKVLME